MKNKFRLYICLLILAVFSVSCCAASADSALDTILKTGTTQSFTTDPVPEDDIQSILRAGVSTASAINQQPWYFVAITNQDLMKEIGGSGMGFGGARPDSAPAGGTPPEGASMPEGITPPSGAGAPPEGFSGSSGASAGAKASLGDSPLAIIVYKDTASKSPSPDYDCGLATQNMAIAAASLGYGVKIVSSPTMSLNGQNHDEICEKLGVDKSLQAVAVLLIGIPDESEDAVSSASVREDLDAKSVILH